MNPTWIADSNRKRDEYEQYTLQLPVNPPGAYFNEGFDVMITQSDIANWYEDGEYVFEPRLRDAVQNVHRGPRIALDNEAPELDDKELDCD